MEHPTSTLPQPPRSAEPPPIVLEHRNGTRGEPDDETEIAELHPESIGPLAWLDPSLHRQIFNTCSAEPHRKIESGVEAGVESDDDNDDETAAVEDLLQLPLLLPQDSDPLPSDDDAAADENTDWIVGLLDALDLNSNYDDNTRATTAVAAATLATPDPLDAKLLDSLHHDLPEFFPAVIADDDDNSLLWQSPEDNDEEFLEEDYSSLWHVFDDEPESDGKEERTPTNILAASVDPATELLNQLEQLALVEDSTPPPPLYHQQQQDHHALEDSSSVVECGCRECHWSESPLLLHRQHRRLQQQPPTTTMSSSTQTSNDIAHNKNSRNCHNPIKGPSRQKATRHTNPNSTTINNNNHDITNEATTNEPDWQQMWQQQHQQEQYYFAFCQLCNDPNSIPPPSFFWSDEEIGATSNPEEDEEWAMAAAAVLAEQLSNSANNNEDGDDDAAFWRDQIRILASGAGAESSFWRPELEDEDEQGATVDERRIPLTLNSIGVHEANQNIDDEPIPVDVNDSTSFNGQEGGQVRPRALLAAQPFAAAFGVELLCHDMKSGPSKELTGEHEPCQTKPTPPSPQRDCFGHKERILGCAFSICGSYLATASQDSTIRVWSTTSHRELSVIRGHSIKHECLRVAWASPIWAQDQIRRVRDSTGRPHYVHLLVAGGADGVVHLWGCDNPETDVWTNYATLDHATYIHVQSRSSNILGGLQSVDETIDHVKEELDDDKPQIYSLQFIDHWRGLPPRMTLNEGQGDGDDEGKATNHSNSFLLTSSDEYVHLWELDEAKLNKKTKGEDGGTSKQLHLREVMSLRFDHLEGPAYGVTLSPVTDNCVLSLNGDAEQKQRDLSLRPIDSSKQFGGDRNANNVIFVFDASYCPANGLLGAALSDGSLRLVNGRGVCLQVLQLPGCQTHLTSFSWDSTGERLATTVATGHLITWGIELIDENTTMSTPPNADHFDHQHHHTGGEGIRATCRAVMEGGHARGRPLYGTQYIDNDELLISWGSDGRVCLWDSRCCDEEVVHPLAILWDNNNDTKAGEEGYPVYAVSVTGKKKAPDSIKINAELGSDGSLPPSNYIMTIAIAGGGSKGGFLGIPVFLRDVRNLPSDEVEINQGDAKRTKQNSSFKINL